MKNVEDDTVAEPTQRDLINAIAGRCRVSVLLVDETPAVKLARTGKGDKKAVIGLASPDGSAWRYATGETEALPRGEYELPRFNGEQQSAVILRLAEMAGVNPPQGLGFLRVVVSRDETYYLLRSWAPGNPAAAQEFVAAMGLPPSATLLLKRIKVDRCAAVQVPGSEPQAPPVTSMGGHGGEEWKAMARTRAAEIIKRQHARDLYPQQIDIADEIARDFRRDGVMGVDGKPLSGAYIKRHALRGITSAKGKQLSTLIRGGK